LAVITNGCATCSLLGKKDGPHEIRVNSSGTFNQIYYKIIKLNNDNLYNVERILCIPIDETSTKKPVSELIHQPRGDINFLVIRKDLFNSVTSAKDDTERYRLLLSKYIDLKSVEVILHKGKHVKGWYIYLTYDYLANTSNDLHPLYPNKMFSRKEVIPNDVIPNNYIVNDSIIQHGSHYAYLVRHGQYHLETNVEKEFDLHGYDKLLPESNHEYTVNIMDSEAVYMHSAFLRYSLAPCAIAIDLAASPFYLLMFSTAEYWMPR